jgi:microsomal dipeptidase-like Zn-dependent dipeptidase
VGSERVSFATDFLKAPERVYRDAFLNADGFLELEYPGSRRTQYYDRRGPGAKRAWPWWTMPAGLEDYAAIPNLTLELVLRGCPPQVIRGILGENYLRLYEGGAAASTAREPCSRIATRSGRCAGSARPVT